MSKKLLLTFEAGKHYPPIKLEIDIPEDLARIIQNTPINSTTLRVYDAITFTPDNVRLKAGEAGILDKFKL